MYGLGSRLARRVAMVAVLLPALLSCGGDGTGPDVSDTEIWELQIEQVNDGVEGQTAFGRRGTITMVMRLNHSTQPDPSCAGTEYPDVTTFVATVEALGSRLQSPTAGGADGSWNCHGFSAVVRLDDGTTHALISDARSYDSYIENFREAAQWSSGLRRGRFNFVLNLAAGAEPFDSHMDVRVQNRREGVTQIALMDIDLATDWSRGRLHYDIRFIAPQYSTVPATTTRSFSWPSFGGVGFSLSSETLRRYRIWALKGDGAPTGSNEHSAEIICLLAPTHPDIVDVIVQGDGQLECGNGWEGEGGDVVFTVNPDRLFVQPGTPETLRAEAPRADRMTITTSHTSIGAAVTDLAPGDFGVDADVQVTAAADAPRTQHSVTLTAINDADDATSVVVVPVHVYELSVTAAPDTVTIGTGQRDTVAIQLARAGLDGFDLDLTMKESLPQGVFQVSPSFSPITGGGTSALALWIASDAPPGRYDLGICATIVEDPQTFCHAAAPLTLVVNQPPELHYDLSIFTTPSSATAVVDQNIYFEISVSSLGGGNVPGPIVVDAPLPPGFTYTTNEASRGSYSQLTHHWTIDAVQANTPALLRIYATADSIGTFTNTATLINGIGGDVNPANNSSSGEVTINPAGGSGYDLEVVKSVDRDTVAMGDTVKFTLVATNHGPGQPLSVRVSDHLPAGLQYVSDDGGGDYNPVSGDWYIGYPQAGASRTIRIKAVALETSINSARIMSESNEDSNSANDVSTVTVTVTGK